MQYVETVNAYSFWPLGSARVVKHPSRLQPVAVGAEPGILVGAVVAQRRAAVGAGPKGPGVHDPVAVAAFAHRHGKPPPVMSMPG